MPPNSHVIAVTGMAFEARIAAGKGVIVLTGEAASADGISAAVQHGCQGIISFGIAGGLTADLKPGTCIVARSIAMDDRKLDPHSAWSEKLLAAIPGAIHGDIAHVTIPVSNPENKRKLALATGAIAVDMESAGAAMVARKHKLPFAALRIVADPHDRGLPPAALAARHADGRTNLNAVWRSIATQPGQVGALARLALDTRTARAALTRSRQLAGPGFGLLAIKVAT